MLEEQYTLHNIGGHNVVGEEKFTRLLRLTWQLDWADESRATLQQWSNALRELHKEYESNKDAYRTNAEERLAQFIEASGGLSVATSKKHEDHLMIIKPENLADTNFNDRYGAEIVAKSRNSLKNHLRHQLEWLQTANNLVLFTATFTFKDLTPYGHSMKAAAYCELDRALGKIKKRLCRSPAQWDTVLPLTHIFQYEYEQGSYFKPMPDKSSPHHIHGLFPVAKPLAGRMYNFATHELDERLRKDLRSIHTVSTFLIEPLRLDESHAWLTYMLKDKCQSELDAIA